MMPPPLDLVGDLKSFLEAFFMAGQYTQDICAEKQYCKTTVIKDDFSKDREQVIEVLLENKRGWKADPTLPWDQRMYADQSRSRKMKNVKSEALERYLLSMAKTSLCISMYAPTLSVIACISLSLSTINIIGSSHHCMRSRIQEDAIHWRRRSVLSFLGLTD